eukprot:5035850-Pleurochrysis_carterae.AAC.1
MLRARASTLSCATARSLGHTSERTHAVTNSSERAATDACALSWHDGASRARRRAERARAHKWEGIPVFDFVYGILLLR